MSLQLEGRWLRMGWGTLSDAGVTRRELPCPGPRSGCYQRAEPWKNQRAMQSPRGQEGRVAMVTEPRPDPRAAGPGWPLPTWRALADRSPSRGRRWGAGGGGCGGEGAPWTSPSWRRGGAVALRSRRRAGGAGRRGGAI